MSEEMTNSAPVEACPTEVEESGPAAMTQDDIGVPAGTTAEPQGATVGCETTDCDDELRETLRQRLEEIINREIEARMRTAEQRRQMDESELIREVLARPSVLRALAQIRAHEVSSRAAGIPSFFAMSSASPATPRRLPRTLAEAREETEKLLRQGR